MQEPKKETQGQLGRKERCIKNVPHQKLRKLNEMKKKDVEKERKTNIPVKKENLVEKE